MTKRSSAALVAICLALFARPNYALAVSPNPTVEWVRQFGTSNYDQTGNIAADALGNVFVAGQTGGTFSGPPLATGSIYVRKYDASGTASWTRQIAPQEFNGRGVVAADGLGNVYVGGDTTGNVAATNAGETDYFLRKYDTSGNVLWTRQGGSLSYDYVQKATVDVSGNVYLVGYTGYDLAGPNLGSYDAFLIKYDALGNKLWSRQIGSAGEDLGRGVTTDPLGNVYVAGITDGSFAAPFAGGESDMFLAKFDSSGNPLWQRQLGTPSSDKGYDVIADGFGNVYLSGYSEGVMGAAALGFGDVVLTRFDSAGNKIWTRQFGTSEPDVSFAASTDGLNNVYIVGQTTGSLGGPNAGSYDMFATKYLSDGTLGWSYQIGSSEFELAYGVSPDGHGNVYLTGFTDGTVGPTPAGGRDAFVVKLHDSAVIPEPATITQVFLLALVGFCRRRRG